MELITGKKKGTIETPTVPIHNEDVLPECVIYGKYSPVDWLVNNDTLCELVMKSNNTVLKEVVQSVRKTNDDTIYPNFLRRCYFSITDKNEVIERLSSLILNENIFISQIKKDNLHIDGYTHMIPVVRYMTNINTNGIDNEEYRLVNTLCKKIFSSNRHLFITDKIIDRYREYLKYIDNRDNIVVLGVTPINPGILDNFEAVEDMNDLILTIAVRGDIISYLFDDNDIIYEYRFKSSNIISYDIQYSTLLKILNKFEQSGLNTVSIDNIIRFACSLL